MTTNEAQQAFVLVMAAKNQAMTSMLWGVGLLMLGAVITGVTYAEAEAGESYGVLWGLMALGAFTFLRGLYYYLRPQALLAKSA